jgi:hypothetical protein
VGKKAISRELYEQMLEAFREEPGNVGYVAKKCDVEYRTAAKCWKVGWESKYFDPAKDKIEQELIAEQLATRARLANSIKSDTKSEVVRQDAVEIRTHETKMVRGARENCIALMACSQKLLGGAFQLSARLGELLRNEQLGVKDGIAVLATIGKLIKDGNESAKLSLVLERLLVGAPTEIIGLTNITVADAESECRRALATIEMAKNMGPDAVWNPLATESSAESSSETNAESSSESRGANGSGNPVH